MKIPYYPAVTLVDFSEKYFIQSISSLTVELFGTNFMNFADETVCWLEDYQGIRQKAFNLYFLDSEHMLCSFDMPEIGYYSVLISNNGF